ncbi:MAG TPA: hypothetical protein PLB38_03650 [bacterium]|nr:hypothetical protein [bacterium]
MTKQKVFLRNLPSGAKKRADVTIGIYREGDQMVKLIQEGRQRYRQINHSPKELLSDELFQRLWNQHNKIRLVKTEYLCSLLGTEIHISQYHACLEGIIVAKGPYIPRDWPIANVDFKEYAKHIPNVGEWAEILF